MNNPSNYPPGVSGNEPEIAGGREPENQGLVVVKISPFRHIIVRLSGNSAIPSKEYADGNKTMHKHLNGHIVYGPAKIDDVRRWIMDYVTPTLREDD